jgi:hypothetical protein
MKYDLILLILGSVGGWSASAGSGAALGRLIRVLFFALIAVFYPAKRADDADERSAIRARVALGRALLVPAGPANHRIAFTKDLAHVSVSFAVRW